MPASTRLKAMAPRRHRGFTLLELMVAISVGLFLLGALLTVQQTNRAAFVNQGQLAQLQDSERMAMNILADVIQSAGYFPDPTANVATTVFPVAVAPASGTFAIAQSITGTYAAAAPGDTLAVRFATTSGDGVLNCSGSSNTTGAVPPAVYVNTISVVAGQLVCDMNGNQYTLVSGVTNFSVAYGVKTNLVAPGNNVDTYLNASQMTAATWSNVVSVMVQLTFSNPLYVAGQGQPQFLTLQRVVGVMNKLGPVI